MLSRCAVLYCCFVAVTHAATARPNTPKCSTPDSKEGECVPVSACPSVFAVYDARPLTRASLEYLRLSQCGYGHDGQPRVCCAVSNKVRPFRKPDAPVNERHDDLILGDRAALPGAESLPQPDECGVQSFENKIFDGEVTAIDEFPWMALIEYNLRNAYNSSFACGGALINEKYILTAAHCVMGKTVNSLGGLKGVRLGEHNIETERDCDPIYPEDCAPPPLDIAAESIKVHPNYQPDEINQLHDIALIRLKRAATPFNDFVRPICLTNTMTNNETIPGKRHFVAGWGKTEKDVNSPVKLKIKVPIVAEDSCKRVYARFGLSLGTKQMCAGGERKRDSCSGDSGGPLMVSVKMPNVGVVWYATGVVSFGPNPCATRGVPGVYTKLADYHDWIVSNIV